MLDALKRRLFRAAKPMLHAAYRQSRGMTLGARVLVLKNQDSEVLLVRHSYVPGWLLPGGGVERGETAVEAAIREVREEAGIIAAEEPHLLGLYNNDAQFRGDHVACFILRQFTAGPFTPGAEIAEAGFFPVAALPDATTSGTRRRLAEVLQGVPVSPRW